jgi:hypothetical protein
MKKITVEIHKNENDPAIIVDNFEINNPDIRVKDFIKNFDLSPEECTLYTSRWVEEYDEVLKQIVKKDRGLGTPFHYKDDKGETNNIKLSELNTDYLIIIHNDAKKKKSDIRSVGGKRVRRKRTNRKRTNRKRTKRRRY